MDWDEQEVDARLLNLWRVVSAGCTGERASFARSSALAESRAEREVFFDITTTGSGRWGSQIRLSLTKGRGIGLGDEGGARGFGDSEGVELLIKVANADGGTGGGGES